MSAATAADGRYRRHSLWLDGLAGSLAPRPPLDGDAMVDVCIVGAGLTGLWTAYQLSVLEPSLRIAVVEREIAGFGASGRNGGWVSAGMAGDPRAYERRHGLDAVIRAQRATYAAVDEIGRVVDAEGVDCGWWKGGQLQVATTRAQLGRLDALIARRRRLGDRDEDIRRLEPSEVADRVRVAGALGGAFSPHCARVDPARLTRGLAAAAERRGVRIHEQTAARLIAPGRIVTDRGTLAADHVLRCTEAFTVEQAGQGRRYLPLYSLMIATEPLPASAWAELGWAGRETVSDTRHLFFYAQRTADDRIAIGGRGAPYALGSPINEARAQDPGVRERLMRTVARHFPSAAGARITHHWGGPLAVPRDWCMSVSHDPATGLGEAGGYSGHGVVAANIAGRTLADLVLGRSTDLVTLPWVGHRSRSWEPEPLRFLASRAIVGIMGSSDRVEERIPYTARRMRLIEPFLSGR